MRLLGAFFIEAWKRKNARLSFEWNCERFQEQEADLPEYTRIKKMRSKMAHSKLKKFFYDHEVTLKSLVSLLVFLGMVSLFLCRITFIRRISRKYFYFFFKSGIIVVDIFLTVLYRVWINVKILPNNEYGQIFVGEGKKLGKFKKHIYSKIWSVCATVGVAHYSYWTESNADIVMF